MPVPFAGVSLAAPGLLERRPAARTISLHHYRPADQGKHRLVRCTTPRSRATLGVWYFPPLPAWLPLRGEGPHSAIYPDYEDLGDAEDIPPEDDTPDDEKLKFRFIDADIGHFMRKPKTAVAREYEAKASAILGLLTRNAIGNPDRIADAAAYLAYGDKAAASAGELADEYEPARKFLDAIASPSSPVIGFGIAMIPLVAQLMRNHEKEIVKPVRSVRFSVKIPFRKKTVSVRIPLRVKLSKSLRAQTVEPRTCASMVFSNPDVMKALKKRGIDVAWRG